MSNLSRRSLVTSAAALPALAVPAASIAATDNDAVFRHLWYEYLAHAAARAAAQEAYEPARGAFDAEYPPCPDDVLPGDHWRRYERLWEKHGVEVPHNALNSACDAMYNTIKKILETDATGLFGIGVKLAAIPPAASLLSTFDAEDFEEAVVSVLADINRLIGTDFVVPDDEAEAA
jgi:hypothetical protein